MKRVGLNRSVSLTNGGNPALNFINTQRKDRKGGYVDLLTDYRSFLNWCLDTGLIDMDTWTELELEQYCYAQMANDIYCQVKSARDCFNELFNYIANGQKVHPTIISRFNAWAELIRAQLTYRTGQNGLELYWRNSTEEMNLPLWLVVSAAVRLIESPDIQKIRICPVCNSLFVDGSRRGNRVWCHVDTCGGARKSLKYFERKYVKNYSLKFQVIKNEQFN